MKKTSTRLMALALTIAVLASLIVGVLPVNALAFNTPNVALSTSVLSSTASYTVNFQTSSFGFVAVGSTNANTSVGPLVNYYVGTTTNPTSNKIDFAAAGTFTATATDASATYASALHASSTTIYTNVGMTTSTTGLVAGTIYYVEANSVITIFATQTNATLGSNGTTNATVYTTGNTGALTIYSGEYVTMQQSGSFTTPAAGSIAAGTGVLSAYTAISGAGAITYTVTTAGTFTVTLPTGGTATVGGFGGGVTGVTPTALVAGANTITVTGTGTFTITSGTTTVSINGGAPTTYALGGPAIAVTMGDVANFTAVGLNTIGGFSTLGATWFGYTSTVTAPGTWTNTGSGAISLFLQYADTNVTTLAAGSASVPVTGLTVGAGTAYSVPAGTTVVFSIPNTIVPSATTYCRAGNGGGSVTVQFPVGTTLPKAVNAVLNINNATVANAVAVAPAVVNQTTLEITVYNFVANDTNQVSAIAGAVGNGQVIIYGIGNPASPNTYTINLKTSGSGDTAYITSAAYTVAAAPPPTNINVYNSSGYFLGQFTTFQDAGLGPLMADGVVLKLDPGTYTLSAAFNVTNNNVQIVPSTGNNTNTIITGTVNGGNFAINFSGTGDSISNIGLSQILVTGTTGTYSQAQVNLNGISDTATNIASVCNMSITGSGCSVTASTFKNATLSISYPTALATVATYGGFTVSKDTFTITGSSTSTLSIPTTAISITSGTTVGISSGTITGCQFNFDQSSATLTPDVAISFGTITGAAALNNVSITNNIFTGNGGDGVKVTSAAGTASYPIVISGNTFSQNESAVMVTASAIVNVQNNVIANTITNYSSVNPVYIGAIEVQSAPTMNINGNAITGSAGYSIDISAAGNTAGLTVTGNNFSKNAQGLNNSGAGTLNAVQNWWGDATGPTNATTNPAGKGDTVSANVTFNPILAIAPTAGGSATSTAAQIGVSTTYDFSTTSGVQIVGFTPAAAGVVFGTEKLTANPKTGFNPPYPAIANGYFDVYISASPATPATASYQLRFYTSGLNSSVVPYYWSQLSNSWTVASSYGVAGTGTFVYVNVTSSSSPAFADLTGTSFVLVQGTGTTPASFNITAPDLNSTQPLSKISFTWAPVANATSYEFILSGNSSFTKPYTVDQTALALPVYQYTGANLTAGNTYFWEVIAYQGTNVLATSQIGYFAVAAPVTTTAPTSTVTSTQTQTSTVSVTAPTITSTAITVSTTSVVSTVVTTPTIIITTNPAATITFTNQAPTVTTITIPPATQTSPAWIWGIIGIGAVLIIVVIVLIVRTRRVS